MRTPCNESARHLLIGRRALQIRELRGGLSKLLHELRMGDSFASKQMTVAPANKKAALPVARRPVAPWSVACECFVLLRKASQDRVGYTSISIRTREDKSSTETGEHARMYRCRRFAETTLAHKNGNG